MMTVASDMVRCSATAYGERVGSNAATHSTGLYRAKDERANRASHHVINGVGQSSRHR